MGCTVLTLFNSVYISAVYKWLSRDMRGLDVENNTTKDEEEGGGEEGYAEDKED